MRAVFYDFDNEAVGDLVLITGDAAHHLNVTRVKPNETILLLNGNGVKLTVTVAEIAKTRIDVRIESIENFSRAHSLSLAIAMPKKDAFEDILKMAVELGINEIHPLTSDYSQYEYSPSERIQRILESALIQSNNPFFPVIHPQQSLKEFLAVHSDEIVFFNSKKNDSKTNQKSAQKKTILIGPEGGFSPEEVTNISNFKKVLEIHLPTPILRAPTAVASSVGYLLSQMKL